MSIGQILYDIYTRGLARISGTATPVPPAPTAPTSNISINRVLHDICNQKLTDEYVKKLNIFINSKPNMNLIKSELKLFKMSSDRNFDVNNLIYTSKYFHDNGIINNVTIKDYMYFLVEVKNKMYLQNYIIIMILNSFTNIDRAIIAVCLLKYCLLYDDVSQEFVKFINDSDIRGSDYSDILNIKQRSPNNIFAISDEQYKIFKKAYVQIMNSVVRQNSDAGVLKLLADNWYTHKNNANFIMDYMCINPPSKNDLISACANNDFEMIALMCDHKLLIDMDCFVQLCDSMHGNKICYALIDAFLSHFLAKNTGGMKIDHIDYALSKHIVFADLRIFGIPYDNSLFDVCDKHKIYPAHYVNKIDTRHRQCFPIHVRSYNAYYKIDPLFQHFFV